MHFYACRFLRWRCARGGARGPGFVQILHMQIYICITFTALLCLKSFAVLRFRVWAPVWPADPWYQRAPSEKLIDSLLFQTDKDGRACHTIRPRLRLSGALQGFNTERSVQILARVYRNFYNNPHLWQLSLTLIWRPQVYADFSANQKWGGGGVSLCFFFWNWGLELAKNLL